MPRIDPGGPRPPYLQIVDDLKKKIMSGELQPDARLPSSRDLMTEYGVASMTVHLAIKALRDEGLAVSSPGRGVYVRSEETEISTGGLGGDALRDTVVQLQEDLNVLAGRVEQEQSAEVVTQLREEVNGLKQQVGLLQAQLIDLYGKVGQPYPHMRRGKQAGQTAEVPRKATR